MLEETWELSQSLLKLHTAGIAFNEGTLHERELFSLKLRHEIAIVNAVMAAYGLDEFDLVLCMLTPKEVGHLIALGAEYKRPVYAKAS